VPLASPPAIFNCPSGTKSGSVSILETLISLRSACPMPRVKNLWVKLTSSEEGDFEPVIYLRALGLKERANRSPTPRDIALTWRVACFHDVFNIANGVVAEDIMDKSWKEAPEDRPIQTPQQAHSLRQIKRNIDR
jgi:hypothetical protein